MFPLDFILFLQIIIFLFITPGTPRPPIQQHTRAPSIMVNYRVFSLCIYYVDMISAERRASRRRHCRVSCSIAHVCHYSRVSRSYCARMSLCVNNRKTYITLNITSTIIIGISEPTVNATGIRNRNLQLGCTPATPATLAHSCYSHYSDSSGSSAS